MAKLNEGYFDIKNKAKSIVSTIGYILNGSNDDKSENYISGSVSQYSKNLVMTFPVLCDNTISPDTASMISKANERNVTTMLQLLFTAMNIEANDGMKVLSQVHKNISTSMDVYDVMDKMNDMAGRSVGLSGNVMPKIFESVKGDFDKIGNCVTEMNNELKYSSFKSFPVNSLSESSLNRFTVQKTLNRVIIKESNLTPAEVQEIVRNTYHIFYQEMEKGDSFPLSHKGDQEYYKYLTSPEFSEKINHIIDTLGMSVNITDAQREEIEKEVRQKALDDLDIDIKKLQKFDYEKDNVVRLIDTDVKKANELQPTVLQINYSEKKENGDVELRTFLAGVKSRLVPVDSTDIIERLIAKNKTKINFLNFIRATTGEIGFFKDFLFAIDQAKLDSKNAVKKGEAAAIWNCLANRAVKNTNNKLKKLGNDASAITVLVLSQETVDYMKNVHKFDLEKMNNTKMICDAYNLMGIMIADESIEALKVFYVGNNNYERLAYSFLEKEAKNSDYKKMVNLMSKMNTR
jgi:hypothetical protein